MKMTTRVFNVPKMTISLFRTLASDAVAGCFIEHGWKVLRLAERPTLDDLDRLEQMKRAAGGDMVSFQMPEPFDDAPDVYCVIEIGESLGPGERYDIPATRLRIIAEQNQTDLVQVQVEYHDYEPFGEWFVRWLRERWPDAVETGDVSTPAVTVQAGAGESSTPAKSWEREEWYQRLTLDERGRYNFLRPHKEDWESGAITDGELAIKAQKSLKTISEWRRNLRKRGAPDMEWKKG